MRIVAHRHTAIIVENLDLMAKFYIALGFKETRRDFEQGDFVSHLIALENAALETVKISLPDGYVIELTKYISHPPVANPHSSPTGEHQYYYGYDHIGFTVDDIGTVIELIQSLGGSVISLPKWTNPGLPSIHAYVTDPEGNVIHLAQNA